MQLINLFSFVILIKYHSTNALPDTNINIQHYDGPVYMNTPKPDCCPYCNSPIKTGCTDNPPIDIRTPETIYPETTIHIKATPCDTDEKHTYIKAEENIYTEEKEEKPCGKSSRNCKNKPPTQNTYGVHADNCKGTGAMLHTNTKSVHSIPVTCNTQASSYGNSYMGGNLAHHFGYSSYGSPNVATEPLSTYLPVTASQNSCYQVPILTYNSDHSNSEPTLIPQKFMYSLILDGDVAPSQNGYNSMCSYY